ncbi:MAG: carboxypeptidase regulatory-like domain-containing protein [Saprospiraceae bacterium]|nr:carboxypeptidase regulatory-like domain-containing protein [Saprospiraceae bacterium]
MYRFYQTLILGLVFLIIGFSAKAQISNGGTPLTLTPAFQAQYNLGQAKTVTLRDFDLKKAIQEDRERPGERVAAPIQVDLGFENAGEWWELPNGDRIWRLRIRSQEAQGLLLLYDRFYLPPGASFFVYNEDASQVHGAYTFESNTPNYTFMTGFIKGETAILEYFEPKAVQGQGALHIFRVDHAYKKTELQEKDVQDINGFGDAAACNKNINCPEGTNWQQQKRGICRIIVVVQEGTGFCTGNLINNTALDEKPYILSAFHCQDGFTPMYDFWRYDFNYESPNCSNPVAEPAFQSVLGSTLRASRRENDFLLLELPNAIPPSYNVFFNGWDRKTTPPFTSFSIHHPKGDIKKIAIENQAATVFPSPFIWLNSNGDTLSVSSQSHLLRVKFDASTVESGSSGAALFDQNGRIVGQLHGGTDLGDCGSLITAYYDRFTLAWEGGGTPETRLKDWLDPDTSNVALLNGLEQGGDGTGAISGFVRDAKGQGVSGVSLSLVGGSSATIVTDTSGAYSFKNLAFGQTYGLSLNKNFNARNGIGILDILLINRHILGVTPLDTPLKLLSADVDDSDALSIIDIIRIRKMTLGIDIEFEGVPAWRFVRDNYTFADPTSPWKEFLPTVFQVPTFSSSINNLNFIAYKMGDVDVSADPKQ